MNPIFRVLANNTDITQTIQGRLISLTITDEAGIQADTASIILDDRDNVLEIPEKGAKLEIYLGYKETTLTKMGLYTVDEIVCSGSPDTMKISCKAADMRTSLKVKKSRSWNQITLGDIVQSIAGEHNLQPGISQELAAVQIKHLDQTNESDLHLLTRLAKEHGAVAKPANGYMLFVTKGDAKAATGQTLSAITIDKSHTTNWQVTMADRGKYQSTVARWHDTNTGERVSVTMGDDKPAFTLRHIYPDESAAQTAAIAKLEALKRGQAFGSVSLPIANLDAMAEGKATLKNFRAGVSGQWTITRVEFKLNNNGLSSFLEFEVPK
ncbi:contractile injection system protein, VgrG/Pvc8 family [Pseudoalteromonas denitrificans]|uniref:Phage protein D n=1 Tax=Pseudoalteromonas denitrificans DSM 6059 TaxID=1123010 RepID=A0A1I1UNJ9_9GAMM|nr:contractile injection system protein, VgrG/Pvc8 family [Pseudoalteromonas denitrificans]SFD72401.1 hypothetical protein SAMN02745724_05291 [Pseudoalteromonas denitrificans DSM 6059]